MYKCLFSLSSKQSNISSNRFASLLRILSGLDLVVEIHKKQYLLFKCPIDCSTRKVHFHEAHQHMQVFFCYHRYPTFFLKSEICTCLTCSLVDMLRQVHLCGILVHTNNTLKYFSQTFFCDFIHMLATLCEEK